MKDQKGYVDGIDVIIIILIGLIIFLLFSLFYVRLDIGGRKNAECKARYGNEYRYTSRSVTDCINEKTGEGKFL